MPGRGAVLVFAACSAPPAAGGQPAVSEGHRDAGADAVLVEPPAAVRAARKQRPLKQPRPVDINLRSTPSGAIAAVDGVPIGETPVTWFGETWGVDVEFTFVKQGYAPARYRFVPVQSGVVHARLEAAPDSGPIDDKPHGLDRPAPLAPEPDPVPPPPLAPDATDGRPLPGPQP